MVNEFSPSANAYLTKNDDGKVQSITHFDEPYKSNAANPQLVAQEYLTKYGVEYGIADSTMSSLNQVSDRDISDSVLEIRFDSQKEMFDNSTVSYIQTYNGLPIWGAGVTLQILQNPYRVLSSYATTHTEVNVNKPSAAALKKYKKVSLAELKTALGAGLQNQKSLKIVANELNIYQYKVADRIIAPHPHDDKETFCFDHSSIELPVVDASIAENGFYVVAKVDFMLSDGAEPIPYIAMIEVETNSVLYLRAMTSQLTGLVFNSDPYTMTGSTAYAPTATDAVLNAIRSPVTLQGLNAPVGGIQKLEGNFVKITEIKTPVLTAPTQPTGVNFNYNVRTNEFAAVNAYYHNDRFFRFVTSLGFPSTYWGTTVFPVPIDHRGLGNAVNAHCVGNGSKGIGHACYALADGTAGATPIGIANDWRVVLHELGGHGILYCSVNSPNFGFAHSAGDSFAAILNDVGNIHPDRFATFPWLLPSRRHDRAVASGWAWGGANDTGGYNSEQIICTTMFRFYRSIGGDSTNAATRNFAARFTVYLLLRAIGNLTPTHTTQTGAGLTRVTAFCNELIAANLGDWTTDGHIGGAYGKVIRWSFEKQGLFQPVGAVPPFTTVGAPPAVDVYINDGRFGEYTFQPNFTANTSIWNRHNPDGIATHQEPIIGAPNYGYVIVKNRGTATATGVTVSAFQSRVRSGAEYPTDWQPMVTPTLAVPNIAPGGGTLVGPFLWSPSQIGQATMSMVVSAVGDTSNINSISVGEVIPDWRLVPNDNNIGQRQVTPVWF